MTSSYFRRLQNRSDIRFVAEMALLTVGSRFFLAFPALLLLESVGVNTGTPNIDVYKVGQTPLALFMTLCLFSPAIETILFQWLPVKILSLFGANTFVQIFFPAIVFAFAHVDVGLINFIGNIPIGLLLTWAFVVKQRKSTWTGLWVTFAIHALSNLFPFLIYLGEEIL